jgi:hypothetical protein
MRGTDMLKAGGMAWSAITHAVAPLEAAQFEQLQAATLLRLRQACLGAKHWSDACDSRDVAVVGDVAFADGAPAGSTPAGAYLGWSWPSVLQGGQALVWRCAVDIVAALEVAVVELEKDASDVRVGAVCKTLRDAVALYATLVLWPSQPFKAARRGLIHINSLRYLSDSITLLPLTVATDQHVVCHAVMPAAVAAAAQAAAAADEQEALFVKRLAGLVKKGLQDLPDLRGFDRKSGLAARKMVQKSCASLRSVAEALAKACPPAVQVHLFCGVLGNVCEHVVAKILALRDMSPQDCDEIKDVFERIWADVLPAATAHFMQNTIAEATGALGQWPSPWTEDSVASMLAEVCLPVRKLAVVGKLLSDRLVDIVDGWETGSLPAVGLTAEEVVGVMRAVFEDNPHRKRCIDRVEASSP